MSNNLRRSLIITLVALMALTVLGAMGCKPKVIEETVTPKNPFEEKGSMARLGWQADYPIMDNFLFPLFMSTSGDNKAFYSNPAVDAKLTEARKTADRDARIKLYQEIEKMVGEDQPLIALVNYRHLRVGSDRIRDFVFNSVSLGSFESAWIAPDKAATTPVSGGTMSMYIAEPLFIDPYDGQESEGIQVINCLFDSLVEADPATFEIKPAAAESWTANEDQSVFTFKLRQGAKFSNGREVKAGDFKYAWERICNKDNASTISYHLLPVQGAEEMISGEASSLAGVKVVDDFTLEVTLTQPMADFIYVASHPSLGPVPKDEVDKDPKKFLDNPIGNGPFKMSEPWKHEQYIKLSRNDGYYGKKPYLDAVNFKIFKDEETAFTEFEAGNLDFTQIPSGRIADVKKKYGESDDGYKVIPGKQSLFGQELSTYYIWFNTSNRVNKDNPLAKPEVRKAISMAINRQAICDKVYEGTRVPATGAVPSGMPGFQENAWPYNKYDVEAAKKMLADAGYPNGEGLPAMTLAFNSGSGHEDVMALVQADLKVIGIETTQDPHEWAEYTGTYLK